MLVQLTLAAEVVVEVVVVLALLSLRITLVADVIRDPLR